MKKQLREHKTCLNCGYLVDQRFCSQCGQENTEVRHSFAELVGVFFKDLTHYEGKFWQSLRYLMTKPAYLTQEYLSGKRKNFVAPVRLYIFVSFVAFLIVAILPNPNGTYSADLDHSVEEAVNDTSDGFYFSTDGGLVLKTRYKSLAELDSAKDKLSSWDYIWDKKAIELRRYGPYELMEKFGEAQTHNFPKAMFLYMPLFAFVIWLFHSRRRWMYFDHAIFTLNYFSFVLLAFTFFDLLKYIFEVTITGEMEGNVIALLYLVLILWYIIYFFRAHYKMYHENATISIAKSLAIYIINTSLLLTLLMGISIMTVFLLH